jgi:phage I-like protein
MKIGGMDRKQTPLARTPDQARHVVELMAGDVPDWVELIPAGEFSGRDGRGPYVLDAAAVQSAFTIWGMPLAIDYEHQAFNAAENGKEAPAAGWVNTLDVRDGALWGGVEWTERASAYISSREYRFLSPVFDYDKQGRVVRLLGAGLTNNPNLYLTALNRRGEPLHVPSQQGGTVDIDEMLERLRYLFNLPTLATQEDILAELDKLKATIDKPETAAMRQALALPEAAGVADLLTASHARLTAEPDPARYVPKAEFDRVTHSLSRFQAEAEDARVDRVVKAALQSAKVSPGMESWARSYCRADPAGFDAYIESAPVLLPGGGQSSHAAQRITEPPAVNPLLTDADRRAGRAFP